MDQTATLGQCVRKHRQIHGLTLAQVGDAIGWHKSSVQRLEADKVKKPSADVLGRLAALLKLPSADLFALAGYSAPEDMPTLRPYLKAAFSDLPDAALADIESHVTAVAAQYGCPLKVRKQE